jgi:hypothetical protein
MRHQRLELVVIAFDAKRSKSRSADLIQSCAGGIRAPVPIASNVKLASGRRALARASARRGNAVRRGRRREA